MSYKHTKEARDNAKNFYNMLKAKRYSLTEGEFQSWMSKHHARTDPYSYKPDAKRPKWKSSTRTRPVGDRSADSYYRSYMKKKSPSSRSASNVFRFYSSRQHISAPEQAWRKTLRVYPQ